MERKKCFSSAVLLLLSSGFFLVGCTSLFYFPRIQGRKLLEPARFKLQEEDVFLHGVNGQQIHAWWFPAKGDFSGKSLGTVVFFHGNAENITSHFASLSWLPEAGYNYLIWDYPGYGLSAGEPSPKDNVNSAHIVLNWAHEKDPRPLIIYGQSLGGNIALRSALDMKSTIPLRAVVIDGSFISNRSVARQKASESWLLWLIQPLAWLVMSDEYSPAGIDTLSPVPLLVIHGQKDQVVAPKFGEAIYEQAAQPKEIWRIPEGTHNSTFWAHDRVYRKKFLEYLEGLR